MQWRLIDDKPHRAFFNMAVDEAISESVRKNLSPPSLRLYLRLYQWSEPSISIGYFQKTSDVNTGYCRGKGYPLVRRPTGGTAILHDAELTYSLSARTDHEPFKGGLLENYNAIGHALALSLKLLNLNAEMALSKRKPRRNPFCFKTSSYGEINVNGQKVIGSAQKRYKNVFLQQGSILMNLDAGELNKVLNHQDLIKDFSKIGTILKYAPLATIEKLKEALKEALEKTFMIKFISEGFSEFEPDLAKQLEIKKYSTDEWNYRR